MLILEQIMLIAIAHTEFIKPSVGVTCSGD